MEDINIQSELMEIFGGYGKKLLMTPSIFWETYRSILSQLELNTSTFESNVKTLGRNSSPFFKSRSTFARSLSYMDTLNENFKLKHLRSIRLGEDFESDDQAEVRLFIKESERLTLFLFETILKKVDPSFNLTEKPAEDRYGNKAYSYSGYTFYHHYSRNVIQEYNGHYFPRGRGVSDVILNDFSDEITTSGIRLILCDFNAHKENFNIDLNYIDFSRISEYELINEVILSRVSNDKVWEAFLINNFKGNVTSRKSTGLNDFIKTDFFSNGDSSYFIYDAYDEISLLKKYEEERMLKVIKEEIAKESPITDAAVVEFFKKLSSSQVITLQSLIDIKKSK